jgi:sugar/nucleoside kinase (ribokinase family)
MAEMILGELKGCGTDVSHVRRVPDVETGQAYIILDGKGENVIVLVGGANMHLSQPPALPQEFIDGISKSIAFLHPGDDTH